MAVTVLVGCHSADPESDPRVAVSPSPGHASTASSVVASRGDAGLVFIPQTEAADCGPAAIAITLSYYGRPTTLDASKAATHFHSEPTSALDLVNAAKANGLGAIGVAAEVESVLPMLRTGDILHFDFNHFVVFDALAADAWRRRHEPNIVLLHYADLLADLDGQMRWLARRLAITVPDARWPVLVEAASFAQRVPPHQECGLSWPRPVADRNQPMVRRRGARRANK